MFATAIIVFREVLEAALLVGIILAATRSVAGRSRWIAAGIAVGLAGAVALAFAATAIAEAAEGMGQELLNAGILLVAVAMLAWHGIWMAGHGRELAASARATGHAIATGEQPLIAMTVIIAAAVLREGSETVLFLLGIARGEGLGLTQMAIGGLTGAAGGMAAGAVLYYGLVHIPPRYLFTATNWLILLLAAGLASQGAGFLVQAGVLPALIEPVWDTSDILGEHSLPGKVLHALIGYVSRPSGMQVAFYVGTIIAILSLSRLARGESDVATRRVAVGAAILTAAIAAGLSLPPVIG
jgi:high-affinity iron transporter